MSKKMILLALVCFLSFIINGCVTRTYTITKERVDQDLIQGNRGYLMGAPGVSKEKPRKATRQIQVIELEARSMKFWGKKKAPISKRQGVSPAEEVPRIKTIVGRPVESSKVMVMKKYTVRKGDTLQSISKKFYGTTKRWKKIYQANGKVLKGPDKIYAGQIIKIPVEEMEGIK